MRPRGYVTSLLSLVGIEADPLASREHILLSNIIANAWNAGETLDLPTLLGRVQQPPMRKLGVFELDAFFPAKDRTAFAMSSTGCWPPRFRHLDRRRPGGHPVHAVRAGRSPPRRDHHHRASVRRTAAERHGDDPLGSSPGCGNRAPLDLRAMLYMDEVAGYLPPTANPPTKKPIMLLMEAGTGLRRRRRAQHPEPGRCGLQALSNAGTWMVGRLSTEQDKARLLAGLTDRPAVSTPRRWGFDLRPRQAAVLAAQGRAKRRRHFRHPLGAQLPARAVTGIRSPSVGHVGRGRSRSACCCRAACNPTACCRRGGPGVEQPAARKRSPPRLRPLRRRLRYAHRSCGSSCHGSGHPPADHPGRPPPATVAAPLRWPTTRRR